VRKPGIAKTRKKIERGCEPSNRKTNKARVKQWLTCDLLPLHLESAALGLDRQLEALDGLALLLEGQLLVCARNTEHNELALGLRELVVPLRQ
jgi:hypothetical protein